MSTLRYDHASPSITLEKGTYWMQAPRKHLPATPCGSPLTRSPEIFNTCEKNYALFTLICFGTAYYLFMTRWDSQTPNPIHTPHSDENTVQVIAFENALVLSHQLNCTLLVPPICLGQKPIRYVKFNNSMSVSCSLERKACITVWKFLHTHSIARRMPQLFWLHSHSLGIAYQPYGSKVKGAIATGLAHYGRVDIQTSWYLQAGYMDSLRHQTIQLSFPQQYHGRISD